jgi:hypothetical protein
MNRSVRQLAAAAALLALTACNMPGAQPAPTLSILDQAATIVAATLRAGGISTAAVVAVTPSPTAATPTATTKPSLFINVDGAKCRSGPGPDFKEIASYPTGTSLDMIAKDTADGYWLVKDPTSGDSCWVFVQDATPGGSFDVLPEITPAPSTQKAPAAPTIFYPNFACDATSLSTSLTWNDVADNETGYRLYRDGNKIADLPANATTYSEKIDFFFGSQVTFSVEAYNEGGASPRKTLTFKCPP